MNRRHSGQFGALLTGVLLVCRVAGAGDGTWTNVAGGNWSTVGNWSGGVADGIGSTAYFNTIDIVSDAVVNLDSSRTNGNLFFGDISGVQSWILSPR